MLCLYEGEMTLDFNIRLVSFVDSIILFQFLSYYVIGFRDCILFNVIK